MATYLVEESHTKQECLDELDRLVETPEVLSKFEWGCGSGDHRGWAFLDGESESAVRGMLPMILRNKAKIIPVSTFTPDQIRAFHR